MAMAEELNALPYSGGSAFSSGMTATDFKEVFREHGEPILGWWRSYRVSGDMNGPNGETPTRQGLLFMPQNISDLVRVQIYRNEKVIQSEENFLIAAGTTMIACLPSEIWLRRNDRILSNRTELAEGEAMPADGELRHKYPASIVAITSLEDGVLLESRYQLNGRSITWIGPAPSGMLLVDYEYYKIYAFEGNVNKQGPMGADGLRLPQHGALRLLSIGEEATDGD